MDSKVLCRKLFSFSDTRACHASFGSMTSLGTRLEEDALFQRRSDMASSSSSDSDESADERFKEAVDPHFSVGGASSSQPAKKEAIAKKAVENGTKRR